MDRPPGGAYQAYRASAPVSWPFLTLLSETLSITNVGRSGPNLKPGTVCVCGINGLRTGMNTT